MGALSVAAGAFCVCCSAADDLSPAVTRLLQSDPPVDHVVIELSGVADPANVQNNLGEGCAQRGGLTKDLAERGKCTKKQQLNT